MSAEEQDWDVRHPAYTAGVREGREQGAKHMRDSIVRYLREMGVEVPPLPRTLGERKEFEKEWDRRVAEGQAKVVEDARIHSVEVTKDGLGTIETVDGEKP